MLPHLPSYLFDVCAGVDFSGRWLSADSGLSSLSSECGSIRLRTADDYNALFFGGRYWRGTRSRWWWYELTSIVQNASGRSVWGGAVNSGSYAMLARRQLRRVGALSTGKQRVMPPAAQPPTTWHRETRLGRAAVILRLLCTGILQRGTKTANISSTEWLSLWHILTVVLCFYFYAHMSLGCEKPQDV